jgi:hypothetical protein
MRSYTIVKALVLSLGAIAVVARSLPEQGSDINARAAGELGFSNSATKRDGADGERFDIFEALPLLSFISPRAPRGQREPFNTR